MTGPLPDTRGSSGRPGGPAATPARRGWLAALLGLAALGVLVGAVVRYGEAERFFAAVRGADPRWLALALLLQAATYLTEAGAWQGVLRRGRAARPLAELYGLAIVSLFTNQVVPSAGVAGTFVVVLALERRGVPRSTAVAAVLVDLIGYYIAFAVAIGLSIAVLAAHHDLPAIVLGMAVGIAVLGTAISVSALRIAAPGREPPRWFRRWPAARRAIDAVASADPALVRLPRLLLRAGILRTGNFALDGLTLWACLRAVGEGTPAPAAFAACVVGTLARTLGLVPGGLGTFEGGTLGGLALFGVAIEPGLAATLLFRGLSFWLPLLPGLWLGRRLAQPR